MKTNLFLIAILVVSTTSLRSQNTIKFSGTITDFISGETLSNATIYNISEAIGCVSNNHGYFCMPIKPNADSLLINISYIGYQSKYLCLKILNDTCLHIQLKPGIKIDELEVKANKNNPIIKRSGLNTLPIKDILYTPVLMGEANLISSLKTLPGVSSGKEGGSELFVRGGNYDQNLILLDEAPVYNLSHAFGLLSVFNASTIKNVNLYKGGVPAEYGRRLSSVLDVTTRDGNKNQISGGIDMSTLASAISLEGPIVKNKASFMFSARRSWIDQLAAPIINNTDQKMGLYFYDINGKLNWALNSKNKFFLSYYKGQDELEVQLKSNTSNSKMKQGWGNNLASFRWNSILNSGAFIQLTWYYTKFNEYNIVSARANNSTSIQKSYSKLFETGVKATADWPLGRKSSITTGFDALYNSLTPPNKKSVQNGTTSKVTSQISEDFKSYSAFTEYLYNHHKIFLKLGIRADYFSGTNNNHIYIQPRLNASFKFNSSLQLKLSSMRNVQPFYAMRKSNNGFPAYAWLPLVNKLTPQESWQFSGGLNWNKKHWMIDVECYYKSMQNEASNYRYPYDIYSSNDWQQIIDYGKGRSYGLELMNTYRNNGWDIRTSYTFSKSEYSTKAIANAKWFPSDYDIRHDASIILSKDIMIKNEKRNWLTANFTCHSGIPFSIPTHSLASIPPTFDNISFDFNNSYVDYFTYPNNYRLKPFHRLDISYNIQKQIKNGSRTWSMGILNVYNRKNQYILYRNNNTFKQLTLFPLMPFVCFKRHF